MSASAPAQFTGVRFILRTLRHRNYRLFFAGQGVSLVGTWMTRMALGWLVLRLTESTWSLGLVGFATQAPTFLLAPMAGALADRWNRHYVLIAAQVGAMIVSLCLAALTLSGHITVGYILLLSALQGTVHAFDIPARQALVVDIVEDRNDLGNAIALNSSLFNGARLVGPAVAGGLIYFLGEGVCFLVDGLSYIGIIAALLAMRLPPRPVATTPRKHVLREMNDGLRATFGFGPMRALLMLVGLIALMGMPAMMLMAVFAKDIYNGGALTLGVLWASSGAGAMAGGMFLASRHSVRGLGGIIARSAAAFGLCLILFAASPGVWLSAPLLMAVGFTMMLVTAGSNTILQTLVDDDKRGRVMSFFAMTFMGAAPLGNLMAGSLAQHIGAPWTVALGGSICIAGAGIFALKLPALRAQARPIYIQRGIIPQVAKGLRAGVAEIAATRT